MHIIPFPTYIHFISIHLGCCVTHAPVQKSVLIASKKPCRSVGQQSTIRSHLESNGRQFLGTNRGDPNAPSCATIKNHSRGMQPTSSTTPNRLKTSRPCRRHVDKSNHFPKSFPFSKIQPVLCYIVQN